MNRHAASATHFIAWLIAVLTALFGASAACVRRVAAMRGRTRDAFARLVQRRAACGHALMYAGEDAATVDRRIARMQWIAADPVKAFRHMARQARGLARAWVCGMSAPPAFAPPVVACAPCSAGLQTGPVARMEPP